MKERLTLKGTIADLDGVKETKKIRVLLADDHVMVREGLKTLLVPQPDIEVIGEASNGREACQKIQTLKPDVAVLKLCLPELNGLEVSHLLQSRCPEVKVLIL